MGPAAGFFLPESQGLLSIFHTHPSRPAPGSADRRMTSHGPHMIAVSAVLLVFAVFAFFVSVLAVLVFAVFIFAVSGHNLVSS